MSYVVPYFKYYSYTLPQRCYDKIDIPNHENDLTLNEAMWCNSCTSNAWTLKYDDKYGKYVGT